MSAKFNKVGDNNYTFGIVSTNDLGSSSQAYKLKVPTKSQRLQVVFALSRLYMGDQYKIEWLYSGRDTQLIESFTLFYCTVKTDEPKAGCDGKLNFRHVDKTTTKAYFTRSKDAMMNFAIAANSRNSTSGMTWVQCFSNSPNGKWPCSGHF